MQLTEHTITLLGGIASGLAVFSLAVAAKSILDHRRDRRLRWRQATSLMMEPSPSSFEKGGPAAYLARVELITLLSVGSQYIPIQILQALSGEDLADVWKWAKLKGLVAKEPVEAPDEEDEDASRVSSRGEGRATHTRRKW